MTREQIKETSLALLEQAVIVLTLAETREMEPVDFGLGHADDEGLQLVVYVNNERYCSKELLFLPHQTCPEHQHPPTDHESGKLETFRYH